MITPSDPREPKLSFAYVIGRAFGKTMPFTAIIIGLTLSHVLTGDDALLKPMMFVGSAIVVLLCLLVSFVGFGSGTLTAFLDGILDDADGGDGDGDGGD